MTLTEEIVQNMQSFMDSVKTDDTVLTPMTTIASGALRLSEMLEGSPLSVDADKLVDSLSEIVEK